MEKLRFQPDRVHGKDFLPQRQYQHPALTLEPGLPNGGGFYFGTAKARQNRGEMFALVRGFSLAFHLRCVQFGTSMGLISDLLRDSPLKPEQLENIAVIEKRMQDEKLSANRELDRLKAEFDRVRTELDQARGLVRMLEQEVAEWRRQIKSGFDDSAQPGAEAGS